MAYDQENEKSIAMNECDVKQTDKSQLFFFDTRGRLRSYLDTSMCVDFSKIDNKAFLASCTRALEGKADSQLWRFKTDCEMGTMKAMSRVPKAKKEANNFFISTAQSVTATHNQNQCLEYDATDKLKMRACSGEDKQQFYFNKNLQLKTVDETDGEKCLDFESSTRTLSMSACIEKAPGQKFYHDCRSRLRLLGKNLCVAKSAEDPTVILTTCNNDDGQRWYYENKDSVAAATKALANAPKTYETAAPLQLPGMGPTQCLDYNVTNMQFEMKKCISQKESQLFYLSNDRLRCKYSGAKFCADYNAQDPLFNNLILHHCHSTDSQKIEFDGLMLKNSEGKCFTYAQSQKVVHMKACSIDDSEDQKWAFDMMKKEDTSKGGKGQRATCRSVSPPEENRKYSGAITAEIDSGLDSNSSWESANTDDLESLTMFLGKKMNVGGTIVQGHPDKDWWVNTYKVSLSKDGKIWSDVEGGMDGLKTADDRNRKVFSIFPSTEAAYVKITPQEWQGEGIAMRAGVLVCTGTAAQAQASNTSFSTGYAVSDMNRIGSQSPANDQKPPPAPPPEDSSTTTRSSPSTRTMSYPTDSAASVFPPSGSGVTPASQTAVQNTVAGQSGPAMTISGGQSQTSGSQSVWPDYPVSETNSAASQTNYADPLSPANSAGNQAKLPGSPLSSGCYVYAHSCPGQSVNKFPSWIRDYWGEDNAHAGTDKDKCLVTRLADFNTWCRCAGCTEVMFVPPPGQESTVIAPVAEGFTNTFGSPSPPSTGSDEVQHYTSYGTFAGDEDLGPPPEELPKTPGCYFYTPKCHLHHLSDLQHAWSRDFDGEEKEDAGRNSTACTVVRKEYYDNLCKIDSTAMAYVLGYDDHDDEEEEEHGSVADLPTPETPGCYVYAKHCPRQEKLAKLPFAWTRDFEGEESAYADVDKFACVETRRDYFVRLCGLTRQDVTMLYIPKHTNASNANSTNHTNASNALPSHWDPSKPLPGCYVHENHCPKQPHLQTLPKGWTKDLFGEEYLMAGEDREVCLHSRRQYFNEVCGVVNTAMMYVSSDPSASVEVSGGGAAEVATSIGSGQVAWNQSEHKDQPAPGCYVHASLCPAEPHIHNMPKGWSRDFVGEENHDAAVNRTSCLVGRRDYFNTLCGVHTIGMMFVPSDGGKVEAVGGAVSVTSTPIDPHEEFLHHTDLEHVIPHPQDLGTPPPSYPVVDPYHQVPPPPSPYHHDHAYYYSQTSHALQTVKDEVGALKDAISQRDDVIVDSLSGALRNLSRPSTEGFHEVHLGNNVTNASGANSSESVNGGFNHSLHALKKPKYEEVHTRGVHTRTKIQS
jgi:hypothetical protein